MVIKKINPKQKNNISCAWTGLNKWCLTIYGFKKSTEKNKIEILRLKLKFLIIKLIRKIYIIMAKILKILKTK